VEAFPSLPTEFPTFAALSRIRDQFLSRDDLCTRNDAASAVSAREEGAEQPESGVRTVQMITR
jgi:hypothetical protein